MKSRTVPILYQPGTYGTYLEWALFTLTEAPEIVDPFYKKGNSHRYDGNHLSDIVGWQDYVKSGGNKFAFARFHPKSLEDDRLTDIVAEVSNTAEKFIYIYPDEAHLLFCLANQFEKTREDWWTWAFNYNIDRDKIYSNWPVSKDTPIDQVPIWIRREFLSYYMMPMWYAQIEWGNVEQFNYSNCYLIKICDLLWNFASVLEQLKEYFDLKLVRPIESLMPTHQRMLSLQENLGVDSLCPKIVASALTTEYYQWQPMSLAAESWVQWQLRNLGYELRCHGLDIFPTDSVKLQELIYKP